MNSRILSLVQSWLLIDFFGDSRKTGEPGSSLTSTVFTQSFIGLVFAVVFLPEDTESSVANIAANLSLSTVLIGIGLLGDTARYKRELADEYMVLTAPLPAWSLTLARVLHRSFYLALVTTGMAIPPAILSYWVCGHSLSAVLLYVALANVTAGLMAGSIAVFTQFVHIVSGPARAQLLAGTLKGLLLGGAFGGFALCLPHLDATAAQLPFGRTGAMMWPPYWAARIIDQPLAAGAFWLYLGTFAGGLFLIGSLLNRMRRRRRYARSDRPGLLSSIDRLVAGDGPLLGITRFVSTMLYRSPGFRGRVLPLFGMPAAMIMLSLWDLDDPRARTILLGITLQFPAIFLPFLVAFLPRSDHEHASWVFQTCPHQELGIYRAGSLIALTTHVLLPVQCATIIALLLVGSFSSDEVAFAVVMPIFSLGLGVIVAEVSLHGLHQRPFTADVESGAETSAFGGLIAASMVLALLGGLVSVFATSPVGWLVTATVVFAAWSRLHAARSRAYA